MNGKRKDIIAFFCHLLLLFALYRWMLLERVLVVYLYNYLNAFEKFILFLAWVVDLLLAFGIPWHCRKVCVCSWVSTFPMNVVGSFLPSPACWMTSVATSSPTRYFSSFPSFCPSLETSGA